MPGGGGAARNQMTLKHQKTYAREQHCCGTVNGGALSAPEKCDLRDGLLIFPPSSALVVTLFFPTHPALSYEHCTVHRSYSLEQVSLATRITFLVLLFCAVK